VESCAADGGAKFNSARLTQEEQGCRVCDKSLCISRHTNKV